MSRPVAIVAATWLSSPPPVSRPPSGPVSAPALPGLGRAGSARRPRSCRWPAPGAAGGWRRSRPLRTCCAAVLWTRWRASQVRILWGADSREGHSRRAPCRHVLRGGHRRVAIAGALLGPSPAPPRRDHLGADVGSVRSNSQPPGSRPRHSPMFSGRGRTAVGPTRSRLGRVLEAGDLAGWPPGVVAGGQPDGEVAGDAVDAGRGG